MQITRVGARCTTPASAAPEVKPDRGKSRRYHKYSAKLGVDREGEGAEPEKDLIIVVECIGAKEIVPSRYFEKFHF